ncbi:MAG: chromosomal replication initiator protein [Sphingobacteriales bacterium]|jgi:chromosomal replication initiator protein
MPTIITDYTSIWNQCLATIKDNVSIQCYKTWFAPIRPIALDNTKLTIQVPSNFFYEWLEEHYLNLLTRVIKKELGKDGGLEYSILMENEKSNKAPAQMRIPASRAKTHANPSISMPLNVEKGEIKNPFVIPGLKKINVESNLNPIYNFDTFVEGDCNRLARSAGFAVANKPGGTAFNPLMVYGGSGIGKTHLAQAIGVEIKSQCPDKTVLYVTSEKFTNQFVEAVRNKSVNDFSHFYQLMDVLIIEDVQFFAGKEKTQEIFFHIFNHLHQNGKQIILTSDKAPVEIQGVEQRLLSRFKWGLSADLQAPDLETRKLILESKMYHSGIELPNEVVEYLAYSITTNVRELEGALISLMAQSSLNKKAITLDLAKQMIDKFVKNTAREVSIDYIQKVVCDYFDLQVDIIKSKTRKREIVQARQISMFFAKKLTKNSLANIGANSGGRDHATVLHACKTVNNLSETDKRFKKYIEDLNKKLTMA